MALNDAMMYRKLLTEKSKTKTNTKLTPNAKVKPSTGGATGKVDLDKMSADEYRKYRHNQRIKLNG